MRDEQANVSEYTEPAAVTWRDRRNIFKFLSDLWPDESGWKHQDLLGLVEDMANEKIDVHRKPEGTMSA